MSIADQHGAETVAQPPSYRDELAAFHAAYAGELRALVDLLPWQRYSHAIDVGCGDGFYMELIAERLPRGGALVGLDVNQAMLDAARSRFEGEHFPGVNVEFRRCTLAAAATAGVEAFDTAWCAQSLYSLPEPVSALRQMSRLVRPGGLIAVLENDTLHQLLMPWSSKMELALLMAERNALEKESTQPSKFYVGRRLHDVIAEAGLEPLGYRTQAIDRQAPLDPALERFLKSHLDKLLARTRRYLEPSIRAELEELIRPDGERYLLRQPHFTVSWLNVLAWGRKPV